MKKLLIGLALLVLMPSMAYAVSLDEAKSTGLVGERNDGYLGYVVSPPANEIKTLVKQVNNKRKAKFSQTAQSNGLQTQQVAEIFHKRAVKATAAGNYYQDASGTWVKK